MTDVVRRVARLLADASSVLFITGAGMSADSGLPTYRGIGGLYEDDDTEDGVPIEEALSGDMLRENPALCWKHIRRIEEACRGARFNRGHEVLARLESRIDRVWVLTQNVDGFHGDAGSKKVVEIHGNVRRLKCTACSWTRQVTTYEGLAIPPRCPSCKAIVRPDVVLFGEMLPPAASATIARELDRGFDLVVSIGTSALFPYIAGPVIMAAREGVPTVEINPGQSEISHFVSCHVKEGAARALDAIFKAL
jgi:NAD-dependent deacetylase